MQQERRLGASHGITMTMAAEQVAAWWQDRQAWEEQRPVTAALTEPLEIVAVDEPWLTTATTDGRKLLFRPAWSAGLGEQQRRQVQEHLVWHAAAGDYRACHHESPHRWHLACDHTINAQLLQLGAALPAEAVLFPAAITWRREEVYAWLEEHPWPEAEHPADQLYGQIDRAPALQDLETLRIEWQCHIRAVVKHYLDTPWLPDGVAAWLLRRQ